MRQTLAFFEEMLGLRAEAAPQQDPALNSWLYDSTGNDLVHVNLREHPAQDGPINHIAFSCSGYDDMRQRLTQAGLAITELDNRKTMGVRQIFLRGPEGARIELHFRGD